MAHVCFNIGYGYFPPKGIVLSSGGPTCLPRGMILIQALKLTSYSSPHFQAGGNRFPRKRQKARDLCLCHSFLPFLSRATGTNSPRTNSVRKILHQTINARGIYEELVVKSLGQTTQSFPCQVSMNRKWSHPLPTPHPWLPEWYFSGSNHETCFLSPLRSLAQRGLIISLSKWKIFILCLF